MRKDLEFFFFLLNINDQNFKKCVFRVIQELLLEMILDEIKVDIIDRCLVYVIQYLKDLEDEDIFQIYIVIIDIVIRCCVVFVIFYCDYKKMKKDFFSKISKSCLLINKIWNKMVFRKVMKIEDLVCYQLFKGLMFFVVVFGKFRFGK